MLIKIFNVGFSLIMIVTIVTGMQAAYDTIVSKEEFRKHTNLQRFLKRHNFRNCYDVQNGATALLVAFENNEIEIAQTLIEKQVHIQISDQDGNTPLHKAVEQRNAVLVNALLQEGANISLDNGNGDTVLDLLGVDRYLFDEKGIMALKLVKENNQVDREILDIFYDFLKTKFALEAIEKLSYDTRSYYDVQSDAQNDAQNLDDKPNSNLDYNMQAVNQPNSIMSDPVHEKSDISTFCNVCRKHFCTKGALKKHITRLHIVHQIGSEDPLICDVCGKWYETQVAVSKHKKRKHSDKKEYICEICNKSFLLNKYLTRHKKSHGKKHYTCETCDKKFYRKDMLAEHQKTHTSEKLFCCDLCEQKCRDASTLAKHKKRKHTFEKNYGCNACEYRASTAYALKEHSVVHSKIKAYKCQMCDKSYTARHNLIKHNRTIHYHI